MNSPPTHHRYWRAISVVGASLITVGIGAFYIDDATRFHFEFISDYSEVFGLLGMIGLLLSFIGCIGWATQLRKRNLVQLVFLVLLAPWLALLIGYPIAGINYHGAAAFVMMLIVPAAILAFVLSIMAAMKPRI
ncbi:MAG: hypothetical protein JWQ49_2554 [Edaphobacter sp.]|nr:hypothetical protein [Edaphobacter sp.]